MKTVSIGVENLCVPCGASCRYCLLSSCGKATGVDYGRGKRFAQRLHQEFGEKRPGLSLVHYIGYCMDAPYLLDYIKFSQKTGAPSGSFLQLNGMRPRDEHEARGFMEEIFAAGIRQVDFTFYGTKEYHDRFAGRGGDFDNLLRLLKAAKQEGLGVTASCPITQENSAQADELLDLLDTYGADEERVFLPHGKGRGRTLRALRLTDEDFAGLSDRVKAHFSKMEHRTEAEWLRELTVQEPSSRTLTLVLKPENIDRLEAMTSDEIIAFLEELDDRYYAAVPALGELARRYGRRENRQLYRFRDLYLEWQQRFLADCGETLWDMNDESHHFSAHY